MLYYQGNLDEDLKSIAELPETEVLDEIGQAIGYGRAQQILCITDPDAVIYERQTPVLKDIGEKLGIVRTQEVLQILWAKRLHDGGFNTIAALGPQ